MPDFARGDPALEAAFSALFVVAALVLALVAQPLVVRLGKRLTRNTQTTLDDILVEALARPVQALILVQGAALALTNTSFLNRWQDWVNRGWVIGMVLAMAYAALRSSKGLLRWYASEVAVKTRSDLDNRLLPLASRLTTVAIYAVAGMLVASVLGVKLTPLLAGLGLGGLAVALALQPTLSNVIASAWMAADGTVSPGDYVEVQGGPAGTVTEVGWRATRLLTPVGNVVMVPNSTLVNSVVTNFTTGTPELNIVVTLGVSYESSLPRVREVCLDECRRIAADLPDSVVARSFEPVVLFSRFADSNVEFWAVMRAKDRVAGIRLTSEMVMRLHERFAREGIVMNYPVRQVRLQDGAPPGAQPGPAAPGG